MSVNGDGKEQKERHKMNANELADELERPNNWQQENNFTTQAATMLRQQQNEIDRLNYDLDGFKQNFFVSGFHLQIKMANEQLVKQQEQIDALKSELDRAVELYTDKAIENEALKAAKIRAYKNGVEDGRKPDTNNKPVAWMNKIATSWVTTTPDEFKDEWIPLYTHPVKELTDEEIIACIDEIEPDTADMIRFARAILRKAQG